jgi:acetoin utilization protein AcuB
MLIKDIMTKQVVAIGPDVPIGDVYALMEQRSVRHFPILEASKLIGIVSDRDIRSVGSALPQAKKGVILKDPVRDIMNAPVLSAHPLDPVEKAARLMRERKVGAMPVLQGEELVGIVTAIDFLGALVKLTGAEGASRLEVEVENRPGMLASLTGAIGRRGLDIASVLTSRQDADAVSFVLRVGTKDGRGLAEALAAEGFSVLWPPVNKG